MLVEFQFKSTDRSSFAGVLRVSRPLSFVRTNHTTYILDSDSHPSFELRTTTMKKVIAPATSHNLHHHAWQDMDEDVCRVDGESGVIGTTILSRTRYTKPSLLAEPLYVEDIDSEEEDSVCGITDLWSLPSLLP